MMKIATAVVIALGLASCTTTSSGKVDVAIRKSLPEICAAVDTGYATFIAVAATGAVKQKTVQKVGAAYGAAQPVCENPSSATAVGVATKVLVAAFTIKQALKEAGR